MRNGPLALLLVGGGVAAGLVFWGLPPIERPAPPPAPVPEPAPLRVERRPVRLFFAQGREILREEERLIPRRATILEEARAALAELIRGPQSALLPTVPPTLKVRGLFLDPQGTAYVDLSGDLREAVQDGMETLVIFSIVDTLTANFPPITRVRILIEGQEVKTVAGAVDLRRPLPPRFDFTAGEGGR